jgi:primosomal protein N'
MVAGETQEKVDKAAHCVKAALEQQSVSPVLGPASLFRVKDRFRSTVLVKADPRDGRGPAMTAVRDAVAAVASERSTRGIALAVDVDPQ